MVVGASPDGERWKRGDLCWSCVGHFLTRDFGKRPGMGTAGDWDVLLELDSYPSR